MSLTTPTTQTVYNSLVDQSNIQTTAPYIGTPPSVYLTRLLTRFTAAAHSENAVLSGLDATYLSGIGTNTLSFTISSGSLIIDSNIVQFPTSFTISTTAIPLNSPSKLRVGIFAAYTFNASTAHSAANNVSFTSYVFDMNDALIAPTIFGGSEKVLIGVYDLDMSGANMIPSMRINSWLEIGNAAILSNASNQLHVTNNKNYPGYAYIDTTIPSNTLVDLTCGVISGAASIKVGNTVPNSSELFALNTSIAQTVTNSFLTTSNNQTLALGNSTSTANDVAVFDNVQVEYSDKTNLLIGDNSTFTNGIGSWVASQNDGAYSLNGDMVIQTGQVASIDLVVGVDIVAGRLYTIRSTVAPTNARISIGTGGTATIELLNITNYTGSPLNFTAPASGTVTITMMAAVGQTAGIADIELVDIQSSVITGDDSLFTTTIGGWVASTATATVVANQLSILDTSGVNSTGMVSQSISIVNGSRYAVVVDNISGQGFVRISGATASNFWVPGNGVGVTLVFTANATGSVLIELGSNLANSTAVFDNVYIVPLDIFVGDTATFATSIGSWVPTYAARSLNGLMVLHNTSTSSIGNEANVTHVLTLIPNSKYEVVIGGISTGTFQVLDGVTVIATATSGVTLMFNTTASTSYTLKFFTMSTVLNDTSSMVQLDIFQRLTAISDTASTFTSVASWKTTSFDNVFYAGKGIRMNDQLAFGAEISRVLTGLTSGRTYRVQMDGDPLAQIRVGNSVGDFSLLNAAGIVNSTFVANATTATVTLRVNSASIGAEADFIDVRIFEDNTNTIQTALPANSRVSNRNMKALSVNNPNRRLRSEISISGHGTYTVKGSSRLTLDAEEGLINALDHSIAAWVIDIPKLKPTATSLAYQITGILQ